ncbi:hypothetical protein Scep_005265 [Stephania cephalantha]|uniref:Uncharacterized protein n=1 Tax=Stephania cephalantha TaxID=152367 RepID=A0AAP0KTZ6_9MAGN
MIAGVLLSRVQVQAATGRRECNQRLAGGVPVADGDGMLAAEVGRVDCNVEQCGEDGDLREPPKAQYLRKANALLSFGSANRETSKPQLLISAADSTPKARFVAKRSETLNVRQLERPLDMVKQLIDSQQQLRQLFDEIRQIDFAIPGLKDLETQLIQFNVRLQSMTDDEELCSTKPIFNPEEDVSVNTLKNFEVTEVTQMEDYLRETSKECEVFQIEPEIVIALNEGENEMKINVISDKPEKPQIEREEDQPLVLVQPPTLPCTFGTPYKGVEVRERSQIFYTADIFVLDDPDATDSFVLEVPNELLNLKENVHALLPKCVDASFVVDISKGEDIT